MTFVNSNKRQKLSPVQYTTESWFIRDYGVKSIDRQCLTRSEIAAEVTGFEWLDEKTHAFTILVPGAIGADKWSFNAFWEARLFAPRTPNPMNRNTFVRRIQATYGAAYKFGAQTSKQIGGDDESDWPAPVRDAVADARARCSLEKKVMVHVNWYDNASQISPHADDEEINTPGAPIFSYTLVRDSPPRTFQVYDKIDYGDQKAKCAVHKDYTLEDGSLLVMGGSMQYDYVHGLRKPSPPKRFVNSRRINITVRFIN